MKIYIVGSTAEGRDRSEWFVTDADKAFASRHEAKQYVLYLIEKLKTQSGYIINSINETEPDYEWIVEFKFESDSKLDPVREYRFVIVETELADTGALPDKLTTELEIQRDTAVRAAQQSLKQLATAESAIAAAKCYLTLWDSGRYMDRDDLLECIDDARVALEGYRNKDKLSAILEKLFKGWSHQ